MANSYYNPAPLVVVDGETAVVEDINDVSNAIETAFDLLAVDLSHTVASHSDTTTTGAELEKLSDNSMVDDLHRHSELSASDGSPDPAWSVNSIGAFNPIAHGTMFVGDSNYEVRGLYCREFYSTTNVGMIFHVQDPLGSYTWKVYDGGYQTALEIQSDGDLVFHGSIVPSGLGNSIGSSIYPINTLTVDQISGGTDLIQVSAQGSQVFNIHDTKIRPYADSTVDLGQDTYRWKDTYTDNIILTNDLTMESPTVPASAIATGTTGMISWDASYIYVCTATNTWKRSAISTW